MAGANIAFIKKGPWYLLHDASSMQELLAYVRTVVESLDVSNVGIYGENSGDESNTTSFLAQQRLLLDKLHRTTPVLWQLQFLTFASLYLLDELVVHAKQNSPQNVCRHFFDTFVMEFERMVFGDAKKKTGFFAYTPLELTTAMMLNLENAYTIL